ncbi:MAG: hypothetical protein WCT32_04210 [Patescibacteria group bacterium]|jgi:hypothetical protein
MARLLCGDGLVSEVVVVGDCTTLYSAANGNPTKAIDESGQLYRYLDWRFRPIGRFLPANVARAIISQTRPRFHGAW